MKRKNIVLLSVVALAAIIFAIPEFVSRLRGWTGYGISSFVRWRDPVIVRIVDGTNAPPISAVSDLGSYKKYLRNFGR
jgi:hypothetical protein